MNFKFDNNKEIVKELQYEVISRNDKIYIIAGCIGGMLGGMPNITKSDSIFTQILIMILTFIIVFPIILLLFTSINKLWARIINKITEKKFKAKYGLCDATIDLEKYTETLDDYSLSVQLKDIRKIVTTKQSFFVYAKKILISFNKKQFEKEEEFYKVLELFQNALNNNKS